MAEELPEIDDSAFQQLESQQTDEVDDASKGCQPQKRPLRSTASIMPGHLYTMKNGVTNSAWGRGAGDIILHKSFTLDTSPVKHCPASPTASEARIPRELAEIDSDPAIQAVLDVYR
jgi:hypothetical protein